VRISQRPTDDEKTYTASNAEVDSEIDLGKELSLLHSYLEEVWTEQVQEKASIENENMVEVQSIILDISLFDKRGYMANGPSHFTFPVNNPPSDYENNLMGAHSTQQSSADTTRSNPTQSSDLLALRTRPAAHLNTTDDYVLSSALSGDRSHSSVNAQAPSNSFHAQHSGHPTVSSPFTSDSARATDRFTPHRTRQYHIYDDTPESGVRPMARSDYHLYDEVPEVGLGLMGTSEALLGPHLMAKSNPLEAYHEDAHSDSDDLLLASPRTSRHPPSRKTRRKPILATTADGRQTMVAAPSSGYQSQNHSSYSSTSSSPVEKSAVSNITSEVIQARPTLAISNPLYSPNAIVTSCNALNSSLPSSSHANVNHPRSSAFCEYISSVVPVSTPRRSSSPLFVCNANYRSNGDDSGTATMGTLSSESSSGCDGSVGRPRTNPRARSMLTNVTGIHNVRSALSMSNPTMANVIANLADDEVQQITEPLSRHDDIRGESNETLIQLQKRKIEQLLRENETLKMQLAERDSLTDNTGNAAPTF
jgi:mRNA-degrading endonuclease toxin of MazEF toxin-antitoxin module